ncbi:hypothetical protein GQ457_03G018410 [Hibiscus cannabinus]
MTRNNPQGPILPLVSDIDRLFRQRRRQHRATATMYRGDEHVDGIVAPEIQAAHFELKLVMFNMLNSIGQFGGSPHEDVELKLKLFPYSLRDRARGWLSGVPAGSLESWTDLCRKFFMRYNPPNMHTQLINDIASFRQGDDESMYECWDRYKGLLRKCTNHGFQDWTQVVMFYNGVNAPTRMMLDASANGTLIANNDYQFPTARLGSGRRTSGKLELDANDAVSAQLSAITNLLKNLQKPSDVRETKALSCNHCERNHHATDCPVMHEQASYLGNYNRNLNHPYSNTYNPGWRQHPNFSWNNQGGNNASNSNRQQNTNAPPGFQANMPWHFETKGNAPTQVGQIAQALQVRPQGNLPSNTEVTKRDGKEHCSALTLRSGKEINKDEKFGGKHVEDPTPSEEQEEPEEPEVEKDSPVEEDKGEKLNNEKAEEQPVNATASAVPNPARDEVRPPPPFPKRLKKHKEDLQFQKFVSMLDQFHINISFLEAIEQVPSYPKFLKDIVTKKQKVGSYETVAVASEYCAGRTEIPIKKKDPDSFIIPCSIGNNFMGNALCDLGSSVNLMPKAVFKKLGIGIERPTTVILQLADRSHVRPEGKVEDVIVNVGKFVFPVDFLILDCEVDDKAPIILGRLFLATGRILIGCEKGDFTIRVADQTMTINVFNTLQQMGDQGDCYHLHEEHTTASEEESDLICCSNFVQIKEFENLKR